MFNCRLKTCYLNASKIYFPNQKVFYIVTIKMVQVGMGTLFAPWYVYSSIWILWLHPYTWVQLGMGKFGYTLLGKWVYSSGWVLWFHPDKQVGFTLISRFSKGQIRLLHSVQKLWNGIRFNMYNSFNLYLCLPYVTNISKQKTASIH